MLSEHLSSIEGISVLPAISLILCLFFFVVTIFRVIRLDKKYITEMGNLPLDSNSENKNNSEIKDDVIP
jgi:hypothetical protein